MGVGRGPGAARVRTASMGAGARLPRKLRVRTFLRPSRRPWLTTTTVARLSCATRRARTKTATQCTATTSLSDSDAAVADRALTARHALRLMVNGFQLETLKKPMGQLEEATKTKRWINLGKPELKRKHPAKPVRRLCGTVYHHALEHGIPHTVVVWCALFFCGRYAVCCCRIYTVPYIMRYGIPYLISCCTVYHTYHTWHRYAGIVRVYQMCLQHGARFSFVVWCGVVCHGTLCWGSMRFFRDRKSAKATKYRREHEGTHDSKRRRRRFDSFSAA